MDKCPITGLPCPHKKCVHVTEVTNFQATEAKDMCASCGLPYIAKEGGPYFDQTVNQVFQMITGALKSAGLPEGKIVLQPMLPPGCPTCGHTLEEIGMTGKFGCGDCYEFYKQALIPIIEKCQSGAVKHTGKMPKKPPVTVLPKMSLEQLENELKAAIKIEDYVKAAALRDEIKKLQSGK